MMMVIEKRGRNKRRKDTESPERGNLFYFIYKIQYMCCRKVISRWPEIGFSFNCSLYPFVTYGINFSDLLHRVRRKPGRRGRNRAGPAPRPMRMRRVEGGKRRKWKATRRRAKKPKVKRSPENHARKKKRTEKINRHLRRPHRRHLRPALVSHQTVTDIIWRWISDQMVLFQSVEKYFVGGNMIRK